MSSSTTAGLDAAQKAKVALWKFLAVNDKDSAMFANAQGRQLGLQTRRRKRPPNLQEVRPTSCESTRAVSSITCRLAVVMHGNASTPSDDGFGDTSPPSTLVLLPNVLAPAAVVDVTRCPPFQNPTLQKLNGNEEHKREEE